MVRSPAVCKVCSPFIPGLTGRTHSRRGSADEVALQERVSNLRVSVQRSPGLAAGLRRSRLAFEILKLWENGRRIRCRFLDGRPEVQAKVEAIAKEWERIANLELAFVTSGASELRISFAERGFSWSTVGTDALTVNTQEATMNFGWLQPNTSLLEYQRVVRHEFGHAIGLIHEHQNPAALGRIPWDKPAVYAHYAQQGWSQTETDENIFDVYAENSTNHSEWDRNSIMQYAVPEELTVGDFEVGWNTEFSAIDIEWTKRQYPRGVPELTELTIGGERAATNLAVAGEVDSFHFQVTVAATYIMDTRGSTDTVLALHGPGQRGVVLAVDHDRGAGANARIVRKLQPGDYWLTVRHEQPGGQGSYTVGVKKRA